MYDEEIRQFIEEKERIRKLVGRIGGKPTKGEKTINIAYFLNNEAKVNHFEFWVLSSLEWRMNDVVKRLDNLEKLIKEIKSENANTEDSVNYKVEVKVEEME